MSAVEIKVVNNKELNDLFNELQDKFKNRVLLDAFKKAVKPIFDQSKQNFNKIKKGKSKTNYQYINKGYKVELLKNQVGVKFGNTNYKAKWLEWGTMDRFKKTKNGKLKFVGKIKPSNFFFKAVEQKKEESFNSLNDNIIQSLERLVKKYENK